MALSYGTITIVDSTDLGQLSAFLSTNKYKEQIADINDYPITYNPNWDASSGGIIITPTIYHNGNVVDRVQNSSQLEITWYEDGTEVVGLANNTYKREGNLSTTGTRHVTYRADIVYYPVATDHSLSLATSASIELSCVTVGTNGAPGTPAKSLQLTNSRAYFTYRATGELYGESTSTLTATKSDSIDGIKWFYLNTSGTETSITNKIANNGNTSAFTGLSFNLSPNNTYQSALFEVLNAKGQLSIYVKETSGGNVVTNGFNDYISIFKYTEAAAGDSVYIASLNNDEETISVYNNNPDLSGAVTQFFLTKGGQNDLSNWHVVVTDNIASDDNLKYVTWNTLDVPNGDLLGISTTVISVNGTQAPTINGTSIATSTLTTNSLVIYGTTPILYKWNGTKWVQPSTTNLSKYGPDKLAVTALDVDYTAELTFTAQHGTYNDSTFAPDSGADAIANLTKIFTIKKNASVISHSLRLDSVSLNRSSNGIYTPTSIAIDAIERTGGSSTPTAYHPAGVLKYTIYYETGTPATTTGTNSTDSRIDLDFTSITRPISKIVVTLGATEPYEDTQTITVSNDGSSPYNINILNPTDTISTTYDYKTNNSYTIDVPFVVMQGDTELNVNVKQSSSTAYPRVSTTAIFKTVNGSSTSTGITPGFYYDSTLKTSGTVNKAKAVLSANTSIGESGYFDLTFELNNSFQKTIRYTYSSLPEALNPLILHLYTTPAGTFVNQSGAIVIEPTLYSGNDPISSGVTYKWEIYIDGHWAILKNKALSNSETSSTNPYYYHDTNNNIFYSSSNDIAQTVNSTIAEYTNNSANSTYLHVFGAAVEGCCSFRATATYTTGAQTIQQVTLTDIDDPIQVKVLSTLGETIVNHQGIGVIYAKVTKNKEEIDPIASKLVVSAAAPTGSDNTGIFEGMLGCVYKNGNDLTYYSRTTTSGTGADWQLRSNTVGDYHWTFRNKNNESILGSEDDLNTYLKYIITNDVNTQFIYIDSNVIDNKITADVRVTI